MLVGISGIAGFIGSHCATALLSRGVSVCGFDNFSGGDRESWIAPMCQEIDCRDAKAVDRFFQEHKPEQFLHVAAYAAENYSHWCRSFLYENNVVGTANVVNACVNHAVRHLVFTSSIAVYGEGDMRTEEGKVRWLNQPKFNELLPATPIDPYGIAKLLLEKDLQCAGEMFGLQYTIFRPHNVFGIAQNSADSTRNFVSIALRNILEGKPVPIYGDGSQTRQFTPVSYVADIIAACVQRADTWNQTYNLGTDKALSIRDMAEHVGNVVGSQFWAMPEDQRYQFLPERHEVVHAACDHSKLRRAFPDIGAPDIHETLREMVEEARGRKFQPYQTPPEAEITKNQPEWSKPR